MAFMMKKKKYKFQVELCLEELAAVPFVNAVLFAKVRLLDGGNFSEISTREEVQDHTVRWGAKFEFVCKMSANASTGVLDPCILRISVRKELKGGRSFQKLGFTDLNLAEFAGSGQTTRRCLLEGYDTRHRQDNSMLTVAIRMNMLSGDILFKVPSPSSKHKQVVAQEEGPECRDEFSSGSLAGSLASGSSGFGSLPKKRPPLFPSELATGTVQDTLDPADAAGEMEEGHEPGHSRNSSNTSQMSKASGYCSLNSHSQHSRQSSSGDSGHIRNPSSGSGLSETGSLDRAKAALERRKKASEEGAPQARVEVTRVNPDSLIDEILRSTNLEPQDESASGLQLFIAKDGTTALGSHEVKSQMSAGVFKQVVMDSDNR
ncbi:protein FAM102A isoform X5 [Zootermopsis nevadensis]|uniref:C2 NT-type domain-containing protein n=1 Tax=Zootermopsis nevadensis TaxID=136037 RepID=A0A067R6P3_ZOONE|nr:protein FAM102A isoform X5 [Zootermopsis nevadensis]KDR18023.1 hypothetical protein L798_07815 [Zootermopsis nevadensis]